MVDDAALGVTHVIRAFEHFSNTAGQALFYEALGATPPVFAHVPVVNAPNSKEKLSKRKMGQFMTADVVRKLRAARAVPADWTDDQIKAHETLNPATVEYYRVLGYLPAAVVNYLGRLGWSMDDHTEYLTLDDLVRNFTLDRVTESPAGFDPDKLYWLAGEHMNRLPVADKVEGGLPFLRRAGLVGDAVDAGTRATLEAVAGAAAERIKLFSDFIPYAGPFLGDLPEYDPKAVAGTLRKPGVADRLRAFGPVLGAVEPFTPAALGAALHQFTADRGLKAKDLDGPAAHRHHGRAGRGRAAGRAGDTGPRPGRPAAGPRGRAGGGGRGLTPAGVRPRTPGCPRGPGPA